jgi:hypothetical protein
VALNSAKSPENILQEELLQERAAVLGRAGESVSSALETLRRIEVGLERSLGRLEEIDRRLSRDIDAGGLGRLRRQVLTEINREIGKYNRAREQALLRHYYLIVTREAMGLRRHHWVEQHYRVPPRKRPLQDG